MFFTPMQKKILIVLLERVLEDPVLQDMVMTRIEAETLLNVVKKNIHPATLESEGFEKLIQRILYYHNVDIKVQRSLDNLKRKLAKNKLELKRLVRELRDNPQTLFIDEG